MAPALPMSLEEVTQTVKGVDAKAAGGAKAGHDLRQDHDQRDVSRELFDLRWPAVRSTADSGGNRPGAGGSGGPSAGGDSSESAAGSRPGRTLIPDRGNRRPESGVSP